jgi:hypothetical protein
MVTEADRLVEHYRSVAEAQGVRLGETERYTRAPDFNAGTLSEQEIVAPGAPEADAQADSTAPPLEAAP